MDFREYARKHGVDLEKRKVGKKGERKFEMAHLVTEARYYAGLTQQQLADRMGTSQPNIARAERGTVELSVEFLERVAEACGTKIIYPTFEFIQKRELSLALTKVMEPTKLEE